MIVRDEGEYRRINSVSGDYCLQQRFGADNRFSRSRVFVRCSVGATRLLEYRHSGCTIYISRCKPKCMFLHLNSRPRRTERTATRMRCLTRRLGAEVCQPPRYPGSNIVEPHDLFSRAGGRYSYTELVLRKTRGM
jgi:hypothetical protein